MALARREGAAGAEQCLEGHPRLESSERGADAEVDALPEIQVVTAAMDVEAVRIREVTRIAVHHILAHKHDRARGQGVIADGIVRQGTPSHNPCGWIEPHRLADQFFCVNEARLIRQRRDSPVKHCVQLRIDRKSVV